MVRNRQTSTFVQTYPNLVQYPDASPIVEMVEVWEVVIVASRYSGLFLLLDVQFVMYVMMVIVMMLECHEWKSRRPCYAHERHYHSQE
jgi:hypothetical protein